MLTCGKYEHVRKTINPENIPLKSEMLKIQISISSYIGLLLRMPWKKQQHEKSPIKTNSILLRFLIRSGNLPEANKGEDTCLENQTILNMHDTRTLLLSRKPRVRRSLD